LEINQGYTTMHGQPIIKISSLRYITYTVICVCSSPTNDRMGTAGRLRQ